MKLKSILLIAIGILIVSYPIVKNVYTEYLQNKFLREWEDEKRAQEIYNTESCQNLDDVSEDAVESFLVLDDAFSQLSDEEENNEEKEQKKPKEPIITLGVIKIEKINVNLPVMDGATAEILKIGAGKLTGTTDIGEIGNTAISAHRSHAYGRNFNRLNEVEEGDIVTISTLDADYNYEVFNIQVVEPDDVSLLKKSKTESILTLITCHPLYTASHRLIVQARPVSND